MDVQCELCPKGCLIRPGRAGVPGSRHRDGDCFAVTYGYPCAVHVDPVEKKPSFIFFRDRHPVAGHRRCNLHCKFCQNWEISQANPEDVPAEELAPGEIVALARQAGCPSIAYTYTEPLVYYEYTLDSCRRVREEGLRNVLVTAGYVNEAPWRKLCQFVTQPISI